MKTKIFKQISKGELKKYDGYKCDFIFEYGEKIKDGEIYIEDDTIFILSNDKNADGSDCIDKKGYKYSWLIYHNSIEDKSIDNDNYKEITIYILEETFEEGEKVYVSDISEVYALKNKNKRIFLYKDKNCKNICVCEGDENLYRKGKTYNIMFWKYIVKIPKDETITIQTKDGQILEISKEKAIELGFNIN